MATPATAARFAAKNPLIAAVLDGHTELALQLLAADPDAAKSAVCCKGFTVLLSAVVADDARVVQELSRLGADLNARIPEKFICQARGRAARGAARRWMALRAAAPPIVAVRQLGWGSSKLPTLTTISRCRWWCSCIGGGT